MQLGSFGFTYGSHGLWYPTQSASDQTFWDSWGVSPPWWEAQTRPGADHLQILRALYESVAWWKLEPRIDAILTEAGSPLPDPWKPRVKGDADDVYIIYFPDGAGGNLNPTTQFALQLQGPIDHQYTVSWFNTRNGQTTQSSAVSSISRRCSLPLRPSLEDWALVLIANDT